MSAIILDGKACAQEIIAVLREDALSLPRPPCLAVIMVGDNPASLTYIRNKERAARWAGFKCRIYQCSADISQIALEGKIRKCNRDSAIHGLIVQLPLPDQINLEAMIQTISLRKDVDGLHPVNQGKLMRGIPNIIPATPKGILELLSRNNITTQGKRVVIVGRSTIVSKPLASLLLLKGDLGDATVTVAHSQTRDLPVVCREADILISAIGKPRFITRDFVKPGAVVVDVGINRLEHGGLCGDVDFDDVKEIASAITPVPGGIGPMTIAALMQNTMSVARDQMVE